MPDPVAPAAPAVPPPNGAPAKAAAAPPPVAPVVEVDPIDELLKSKPYVVKNKAGKEVTIRDRKTLDHYTSKAFGANEAFDRSTKLEQELRQREDILRRIEAGDDGSVEMLRKALGPKWRSIVEKEALRDFEEEERMKGVPPHIRERLEEAKRLKAEKEDRDAVDQRAQWEKKQADERQQLAAVHEDVKRIGIPALQKVGFPSNPPAPVIFRLASYMGENIDLARERGIEALPVEVVAEALKEDMQAEYKAIANGFISTGDFDGAVKWLGDDFINFMRRSDLARLRQGGNPAPAVKLEPAAKKDAPDDFWRR